MDVENLIDIYETRNDTRTQRKQSRFCIFFWLIFTGVGLGWSVYVPNKRKNKKTANTFSETT